MASHKNTLISLASKSILTVAVALCAIPFGVHAATLSFSAGQGYAVGQTFPVPVVVSTASGESINAISANLSFNANQLKLVSISKSSSIVNMWAAEPTFSNQAGTADIEGLVLNPGFSGQNGVVATLNFKALTAGMTTVSFGQASVMANDGAGTNVLTAAPAKSIYLGAGAPANATSPDAIAPGAPAAPAITSTTNPDSSKWYNVSTPTFAWTVPSDVTAVRVQYDDAQVATPSVASKTIIASRAFTDVPDGVHFVHVQFKNTAGWGAVAHFKFQTDTTPPVPFKITATQLNTKDAPQALTFVTTDAASGIDHYDVKIGDADPVTLSADKMTADQPYALPSQTPGTKPVVVNAYDKAGNFTSATAQAHIESIDTPLVDSYPSEIEKDTIVRIIGRSVPNTTVAVTMKDRYGAEVVDAARADATGHYSLIWTKDLTPGMYSFTVIAIDARGVQSYPTPAYTMAVTEKALYRIGTFVIDWLSVGMIIFGAGILVVAGIMYAIHRLRLFRRKMRREITDAEKTVHQRFADLQSEVLRHITALESAKSKRDLTKEEKRILESFKKQIDAAEREVIAKLDKIKEGSE